LGKALFFERKIWGPSPGEGGEKNPPLSGEEIRGGGRGGENHGRNTLLLATAIF